MLNAAIHLEPNAKPKPITAPKCDEPIAVLTSTEPATTILESVCESKSKLVKYTESKQPGLVIEQPGRSIPTAYITKPCVGYSSDAIRNISEAAAANQLAVLSNATDSVEYH